MAKRLFQRKTRRDGGGDSYWGQSSYYRDYDGYGSSWSDSGYTRWQPVSRDSSYTFIENFDKWLDRQTMADGVIEVTPVAKSGVVETNYLDRALSSLVKLKLPRAPESFGEVDLASDIFHMLLSDSPETIAEPPDERLVNHILINWIKGHPFFQSMHATSHGDILTAVVAASSLWEELTKDDAILMALQQQRQIEEMLKNANKSKSKSTKLSGGGGNGDGNGEGDGEGDGQSDKQKLEEAVRKAREMVEKYRDDLFGAGMMSLAMKEAREKSEDINNIVAYWGNERGDFGDMSDLTFIMQFVRANSHILSSMSRLLGRLKSFASNSYRKQRISKFSNLVDAGYTKDFLKLFPSERLYLSDIVPPYLRARKVLSVLQSGLPGYVRKGDGEQAGAFVMLVDDSGSMTRRNDYNGVQIAPVDVAKTFALGIASALKEAENRPYTISTFSSHAPHMRQIDDRSTTKQRLTWAVTNDGGGTDIGMAIDFARRTVTKYENNGVFGTDVIILTDGYGDFDSATAQRFEDMMSRTGSRLYTIILSERKLGRYDGSADRLINLSSMAVIVPVSSFVTDPEKTMESIVGQMVAHRADIATKKSDTTRKLSAAEKIVML